MALPTVTAGDLKTRYPVFATQSDPHIEALLVEARGAVSEAWIEADQKPAMLAYAAHLLVSDGGLSDTLDEVTLGSIGVVTQMRAGDHELRFANGGGSSGGGSSSSSDGLSATPYGRRFLELARRSFPPIAVV